MSYSDIRFKADIDWIEISIETEKNTNRQGINSVIAKHTGNASTYIAPYDGNGEPIPKNQANQGNNVFRIRFQDPKNWAQIDNAIVAIESAYGFLSAPQIEALEVAVDAYLKNSALSPEDVLPELVVKHLYRLGKKASKNERIGKQNAPDGLTVMSATEAIRLIRDQAQIRIGSQRDYQHKNMSYEKDAISQRLYYKTTDKITHADQDHPEIIQLPKSQCRARIELTLQQGKDFHALNGENKRPTQSLADFKNYRFENLTHEGYFRFFILVEPLSDEYGLYKYEESRAKIEREKDESLRKDHRQNRRCRNKHRAGTKANKHLNKCVRDALSGLTKRWCKNPEKC